MAIPMPSRRWITMMIPTLLALSTVLAQDGGTLDIHVVASKEVEVNFKFGPNDFYCPVRPRRSLHMSFNPSKFTSDDFFLITIGLINSNEGARTAKFLLIPGYSEEVLKFRNVTITLYANYKCAEGLLGVRCSMKNVYRNPFKDDVTTSTPANLITESPAAIKTETDTKTNFAKYAAITYIFYCVTIIGLNVVLLVQAYTIKRRDRMAKLQASAQETEQQVLSVVQPKEEEEEAEIVIIVDNDSIA